MRTLFLLPLVFAVSGSQDTDRRPEPSLIDAARGVDRAWGENDADSCRALIQDLFQTDMELFLSTTDLRGALPRQALLQMADALREYGGEPRSWTTETTSWFVGRDLAVRKGREKLSQSGEEVSILTTNVFARRDEKWILVHAHHSIYDPPD